MVYGTSNMIVPKIEPEKKKRNLNTLTYYNGD